eukprot:1925615-Amphidinium_carterae.1
MQIILTRLAGRLCSATQRYASASIPGEHLVPAQACATPKWTDQEANTRTFTVRDVSVLCMLKADGAPLLSKWI